MNQQKCIDLLREQDLNVIPLRHESKTPTIMWKEYQIKRYEGNIPLDSNIGVICGKISDNLVVVDIDIKDENLLNKIFPNACHKTLVVETSKGYHIYIKVPKCPNTLRLDHNDIHIDVQSYGTYVVAPTSLHPDTKKEYKIISDTTKICHIDFVNIQVNLESLGFNAKQNSIKEIEKNGVSEGSRNDSMFKMACKFLREHDEATALTHLKTVNERNMPPLDSYELDSLFESAKKYSNKQENRDENSSEGLLEFAKSQIRKIVISQNNSNEVYAVIEIEDHLETLNLSSKRAIYWLNNACHIHDNSGKVHSEDFYKNVLNAIIAKAQMNKTCKEKVHNRTAFVDDTLYYDLCTPNWEIVKITKNDIEIVSFSESIPIFRRAQSEYAQIKPVFGKSDSLEKIINLLKIKDRHLFKVHLVCMFIESISVPIMFFDGEAGSMKTTTTATIKRIIDPNGDSNEDNCTAISTRNDDLIIQLFNRYVSAFDNVTKVSQEMSDTLCRAITGSGNLKRELYTNAEETILNFRRKIILNGIVPSVEYPDLQDRIISYVRQPLKDNERLTDQEFQQKFNQLLPSALGQIFTLIQKALKQYDSVKQEVNPKTRLADFELWGEAISREIGYEKNSFLQVFYANQEQSSIESIDSQPLVTAIHEILENKIEYEDTMTNCFNLLKSKAMDLGMDITSRYVKFPKAPNQLSRHLIIIKPILKKLGIDIKKSHYTKNDGEYTKNSSIIKFTKLGKEPSLSLPSLLFENDEMD